MEGADKAVVVAGGAAAAAGRAAVAGLLAWGDWEGRARAIMAEKAVATADRPAVGEETGAAQMATVAWVAVSVKEAAVAVRELRALG